MLFAEVPRAVIYKVDRGEHCSALDCCSQEIQLVRVPAAVALADQLQLSEILF